ncbi:hypothetical protein Bbelb_134030 [Branchiostoma belcheri]|nr:hypothetical protein Bbelb_134030 [Branchiostoma belcheri]
MASPWRPVCGLAEPTVIACGLLKAREGRFRGETGVAVPVPGELLAFIYRKSPPPSPPSCLLVYDPCPSRGCDAADQNGTIPISSAHPALTLTQNIEKTLRRDAVKSDIQGAVLKALWRAQVGFLTGSLRESSAQVQA